MKVFDTYKEALAYSLTVKWKVTTCNSGEKCWCRMIDFEEEIKYKNNLILEDLYVVNSGSLPKEYAEYLVKLHNQKIETK